MTITKVSEKDFAWAFQDIHDFLIESNQNTIISRFDGNNEEHRILFNKEEPDYPLNLVRMLASVVKHGNIDDNKPFEQSISTLKHRQLSMTCGYISILTQQILKNLEIPSRIIATLTLEDWNTYDNGHTLLEIYQPKLNKWVAVDLDTKTIFKLKDSTNASLMDLTKVGLNDITLGKLTSTPIIDYSGITKTQIFAEYMASDLRKWYQRVFQVFSIQDNTSKKYVFMTNNTETAKRLASYSPEYTTLSPEEFAKKYYTTTGH